MWALSRFLYGRPGVNWISLRLAVVPQMLVDELGAVVGVDAPKPEGQRAPQLLERPCTATWLLSRTAAVSECTNSPSPRLPQCATRSISVNPRLCTSRRSVRSGIWC